MRALSVLVLLLSPVPALAHVGHLDAVDGHAHYLAAWALLGVIAGSAWLIWTEPRGKARRGKAKDPQAGG